MLQINWVDAGLLKTEQYADGEVRIFHTDKKSVSVGRIDGPLKEFGTGELAVNVVRLQTLPPNTKTVEENSVLQVQGVKNWTVYADGSIWGEIDGTHGLNSGIVIIMPPNPSKLD